MNVMQSPTTTPEWLCYVLRPRIADIPVGVESILWPDLLHLAQHHGVAPLVYHRLKTAGLQNSGTIHWEHMTERATTWQVCHAAYITFAFAEDMFASRGAGQYLKTLKPVQMDPNISPWIKHHIFQGASGSISVIRNSIDRN